MRNKTRSRILSRFFPLAIISVALQGFFASSALAQAPAPGDRPANKPVAQKPALPPSAPPAATSPSAAAARAITPPINPNDPNVQAPQSFNIFSGMMDPFDYDPRGRRDPFGQPQADKPLSQGLVHGPVLPLQRFELNQLRLTAILWDVRSPKAMLKDPNGVVYVVTPNSKIGPRNGYVAAIREGEIVVVETIDEEGRLVSTAQVVKIAK